MQSKVYCLKILKRTRTYYLTDAQCVFKSILWDQRFRSYMQECLVYMVQFHPALCIMKSRNTSYQNTFHSILIIVSCTNHKTLGLYI